MQRNNKKYRKQVEKAVVEVKLLLQAHSKKEMNLRQACDFTATLFKVNSGAIKSAYYHSLRAKEKSHGNMTLTDNDERILVLIIQALEQCGHLVKRNTVQHL